MQAKVGHNSQPLLEQGLVWRVGNRESIRIWGDKWLPHPVPHQIQSLPHGLDPEARVCSLIDREIGWWNFSLIQTVFDRDEAE